MFVVRCSSGRRSEESTVAKSGAITVAYKVASPYLGSDQSTDWTVN